MSPTSASPESCNIDIACVTPSGRVDAGGEQRRQARLQRSRGLHVPVLGHDAERFDDVVHAVSVLAPNHLHPASDAAFMASTLNVYWFFRAQPGPGQACNITSPPPFALQTGGAMLLARSDDWDWMLLRLNTRAAGRRHVLRLARRAGPRGRDRHRPPSSVAAISAKFSQGNSTVGATELSPATGFSDGSSFVRMRWSQGTTENGSSGSGLFTFLAERRLLRGARRPVRRRRFVQLPARRRLLLAHRQHAAADPPVPDARRAEYDGTGGGGRVLQPRVSTTSSSRPTRTRSTCSTPACSAAGSVPASGSSRTTRRQPGTNPVCRFYLRPERRRFALLLRRPERMRADARAVRRELDLREPERVLHRTAESRDRRLPCGNPADLALLQRVVTNHRYTPDVTIRDALRFDPRWVAEGYGPDAVIMCAASTN